MVGARKRGGLGLLVAGVTDPSRSRIVALAVAAVAVVLIAWGYVEAMRVPRVRRVDVHIPGWAPGWTGYGSCCSRTPILDPSTAIAGRRASSRP